MLAGNWMSSAPPKGHARSAPLNGRLIGELSHLFFIYNGVAGPASFIPKSWDRECGIGVPQIGAVAADAGGTARIMSIEHLSMANRNGILLGTYWCTADGNEVARGGMRECEELEQSWTRAPPMRASLW